MSFNRELNSRLFIQNEQEHTHGEHSHEYEFYNNVVAGDIEAVTKWLANPDDEQLYDSVEFGRLSKNKLQNIRYHFVVSVALITRLCVENGLERELAYTLSDLYISKMDLLTKAKQITLLHNEMLLDFAGKMADLPKQEVYSMQIVKAIEYICRHRTRRLTVDLVALELGINRSYLSTLFKKETGMSISSFIRSEKISSAANMLKFSDYSYSEIANYFGFASQSHFIACFAKQMGVTPREFRQSLRTSSL